MLKVIAYVTAVIIISIFFPRESYADGISPLLNLFTRETIFPASIVTLVIVLIEALLLRWRIPEIKFKNHLWRSAIINIASSATGSLIVLAMARDHYFVWESFSLILPLFVITLITETPILKALYKEVNIGWKRTIKLSIGINVSSYFAVILLEFGLLFIFVFLPPITPKSAAKALVEGRDFGDSGVAMANRFGDSIIDPLIQYSKDFSLLNGRNSSRIAEVLGKNKSVKSNEILVSLWNRENPYARLVGAIGLAQHHEFPKKLDADSFLIQHVQDWIEYQRGKPSTDSPQFGEWMMNEAEVKSKADLSILALSYIGDSKALPHILTVLRLRGVEYWTHATACEAVARIASTDAIPVLEDCLKSPDFSALPYAFRALITLNDKQAIPLAIARVTPEIKNYNSGFVVKELSMVTGKDFGYNREQWQSWWKSNEQSWTIPSEYRKPYDEQRKLY